MGDSPFGVSNLRVSQMLMKNLHKDPDGTWADYFFNGGNTITVVKAKKLKEVRQY